ncbi:MAG: hypothetical protein H7145_16590 [Akkermansiaceae bacterium]|nr:hypothetical protein [Armatimonadota bacterium]
MALRLLVALLSVFLPSCASAFEPPVSAASVAALSAGMRSDVRHETLPGDYVLLLPEPFVPPTPAKDPVYKIRTSRVAYIYERVPMKEAMVRRVVVHFESDDRDSAVRSARLIARLMRLHRDHFGRETTFRRSADVAHVWFVPTPPNAAHAGGETRDANVYVFAASRIMTSIELVRTVAHEWGHLTLPAARGYAEPENDAAGYLGERLYIKWLLEDRLTSYPDNNDAFAKGLSLYNDRQVTPLMQRWQEGGAASKILTGDATDAMDYYIGAVLDCDRAFGSKVVGEALFTITNTGAGDFLTALSATVSRQLETGLSVGLPAWIPMKAGKYEANNGGGVLLLKGMKSFRVPIEAGRVPFPRPSPGRFRITAPGWNKASVAPGVPDNHGMHSVHLKSVRDKETEATQ